MDKSLDGAILAALDVGAIMQTICLAAVKHGLGTCIEDQGIMYPEVVKAVYYDTRIKSHHNRNSHWLSGLDFPRINLSRRVSRWKKSSVV